MPQLLLREKVFIGVMLASERGKRTKNPPQELPKQRGARKGAGRTRCFA